MRESAPFMEIPDHGLYGLDGPVSLAVQRSAPGHWLLRAPSDDPLLPPVVLVAAVEAPDYARAARTVIAMRSYPPLRRPETRAEYGNVDWRTFGLHKTSISLLPLCN